MDMDSLKTKSRLIVVACMLLRCTPSESTSGRDAGSDATVFQPAEPPVPAEAGSEPPETFDELAALSRKAALAHPIRAADILWGELAKGNPLALIQVRAMLGAGPPQLRAGLADALVRIASQADPFGPETRETDPKWTCATVFHHTSCELPVRVVLDAAGYFFEHGGGNVCGSSVGAYFARCHAGESELQGEISAAAERHGTGSFSRAMEAVLSPVRDERSDGSGDETGTAESAAQAAWADVSSGNLVGLSTTETWCAPHRDPEGVAEFTAAWMVSVAQSGALTECHPPIHSACNIVFQNASCDGDPELPSEVAAILVSTCGRSQCSHGIARYFGRCFAGNHDALRALEEAAGRWHAPSLTQALLAVIGDAP